MYQQTRRDKMKKTTKKPVVKNHPYKIGEAYFMRTVTHHITGRLMAVYEKEFVFTEAAWIADDGRFYDAMKNGILSEVEPWPEGEVIVGRGSLIDCQVWGHALPRTQK